MVLEVGSFSITVIGMFLNWSNTGLFDVIFALLKQLYKTITNDGTRNCGYLLKMPLAGLRDGISQVRLAYLYKLQVPKKHWILGIDLRGIRTRIIRIEFEHIDRYTTTTWQFWKNNVQRSVTFVSTEINQRRNDCSLQNTREYLRNVTQNCPTFSAELCYVCIN